MLYISIDKEESEAEWRMNIKKGHLAGYHIRANKKLQDDLTILIWGAKDAYSLPHYLLFNKNGVLLDKNLPKPSTGAVLQHLIQTRLSE